MDGQAFCGNCCIFSKADVTSKTTLDAYAALRVPEVWMYDTGTLTLYLLDRTAYQLAEPGRVLPDVDVVELMPRLVQQALAVGTSTMRRDLRRRLQAEKLPTNSPGSVGIDDQGNQSEA